MFSEMNLPLSISWAELKSFIDVIIIFFCDLCKLRNLHFFKVQNSATTDQISSEQNKPFNAIYF